MGAIVKELKEKITAAGGDTTGVQTVSEALDKLPSGGGSSGAGGLRLYLTYDSETESITLDKTAKEIADAFDEHGNVYWIRKLISEHAMECVKYFINAYSIADGTMYEFYTLPADYSSGDSTTIFTANTPTSYPVASNR